MGRSLPLPAVCLLLLLVPAVAAAPGVSADDPDLARLSQIIEIIKENYADDVPSDRLLDGAIRGMMGELDRHSQYLDETSLEDLRAGTNGSYDGVGLGLVARGGEYVVVTVTPGSPASRAGIRIGERLVAVDDVPVRDMSIGDVVHSLRGPAGSGVRVRTGPRAGETAASRTERTIPLTRGPVRVATVVGPVFLPGDIVYVRVVQFSERTNEDFGRAMGAVAGRRLRGLVLDLRDNPGGLLGEGVDLAERFVPRGKLIVSTEGRNPSQDRMYVSSAPGRRIAVPVSVLVDQGTASAAEVVAGALQDWDLAVVVGERTYGKGSVQSILPLDEHAGVKLTTARYYTPSGRTIDRSPRGEAAAGAREAGPSRTARTLGTEGPARAEGEGSPGAGAEFYATASGRVVRGREGIEPDVAVAPAASDALVDRLEREGYFVTFAHDAAPPPAGDAVGRFRSYVERESGERIPGDSWSAAAQEISWRIERERTRTTGGDSAAAAVAVGRDPQVLAAAALLRRDGSLAELLHRGADESGPRAVSE